VGNPGRPGRADVAPPRPFVDRKHVTLVLASAYCAALAVRSRLGPNVNGVAAGIQKEVSYYHSRDAWGLVTGTKTPLRAGLPPRRSPTLGRVHSGRRGPAGFPESGCAHTGAVHGACGIVLPRVAPAFSMEPLNVFKYTRAKGV